MGSISTVPFAMLWKQDSQSPHSSSCDVDVHTSNRDAGAPCATDAHLRPGSPPEMRHVRVAEVPRRPCTQEARTLWLGTRFLEHA
jgi:hypothetical protein